MSIRIRGARQNNLHGIDVEIGPGLTVVTGVSGSGKTSLVFDTLYHEARRRFLDIFSVGAAAARLAPAHVDSITGLGPAVAVGQNLLNRNPASTLASASGLHPFLRLLYARFGRRTCPRCGASLQVYREDEIVERLTARSQQGEPLRLLAPLLRGVPGRHALLLHALAGRFGSDSLRLDGAAWQSMTPDPALPHDLDLSVAVLEPGAPPQAIRQALQQTLALGVNAIVAAGPAGEETLARAPICLACGAWFGEISPVQFHQVCPHCQGKGCPACSGSGLPPEAAAVRWGDLRFPELLALSVDEARARFAAPQISLPAPRLLQEIRTRLDCLERVGLGYITLDRPSPTLSRGEAQRVRLAVALVSRLEDMLHVLDEPTIGQHPADVQRLVRTFSQLPGPVVFVEHDRIAAAEASQAIDIGPGAGPQGGQVVFRGPPAQLWQAETATGRFFSGRQRLDVSAPGVPPRQFLTIKDAALRNLRHIDVPIPLGRLIVVTGVSGSGKSTLVEDVLFASLQAGKPVGCAGLDGPRLKPVMVDQSPIGRSPRSNPATYTKLADLLRDLFASATGLSPSHFSFNRPEGACPTCGGLGAVEVTMRYLPSTWIPCEDCAGQRFSEEVLAARLSINGRSYSIAEFLDLTIDEARPLIASETRLSPASRQAALRILAALDDIGLGYLSLGQPSTTLSGGEAQRVKLAKFLSLKSLSTQLLILDEPSTGLHPQDLAGLLAVLDRLVQAGATVLVVEHNTDVIRRAGWVIDLGPGAGPGGGKLLYAGPPAGLLETPASLTGRALLSEENIQPHPHAGGAPAAQSPSISIRGAHAHNLKNVDVDFPKAALTVVTGVSGSGKSSLVSDVLEVEARRRFLESLSLYERQGVHEGAEAEADAVSGLGVAVSITPDRVAYARRATVGTASELTHHLAVLLSTAGQRACLQCGAANMQSSHQGWTCPQCGAKAAKARPQHFSSNTYASACLKCNGVGSLIVPRPEKLIIHPEKPLVEGAMYSPGFFPNGYLGKPFNHGYYQVLALGQRYGFDPHTTPWQDMSPAAQQAFLFGDPEPLQVTAYGHGGHVSTRMVRFPGFYGFLRDWDVGGTYTVTQPCPQCGGARLRPEYLAVTLGGYNMHALSQMPLIRLAETLNKFEVPGGIGALTASSLAVSSSLAAARRRLGFLCQVGLSYLHLDQVAGTLSAGEVQRIRLAGLLGSGLTSLTLLLDEPTRGLHPSEVEALLTALLSLRDEGNTVIVVEHDPQVMRRADYLIDVGPGAGQAGGQIVAQGPPARVAQAATLTAAWLRGESRPDLHLPRRQPEDWLVIHGARANNLHDQTVHIPLGVLVGVCGVSGSGKSSLVIDTLGRALAPRKQTTSVAYEPVDPGEHDRIEGAPPRTLLVDQSRAGLYSPAAFLGLAQPLRALYAASPEARALGLGEEQLSARCSVCGGSGVITYDMAFLPDLHVPCETCQGTGFLPEAWQVRLQGYALPELNSLSIDQVYDLFGDDPRLAPSLQAARQVGLGYLVLRQPGYSLSGGEAQRLKIAQELIRPAKSSQAGAGTLYILDEPTVGQHLEDVGRLCSVLHNLVGAGGSVLVVEHHPHLLAACDWLVELGPGGGPQGGRVIAAGTPEELAGGQTPTAPYLRQVLEEAR
jgi:excinuclease ABC subunit A